MFEAQLNITNTDTKETLLARSSVSKDKFSELVLDPEAPLAKVSMNLAVSLEYSSLRVGATVTIPCTNNETMINRAGAAAFYKAAEFVKDGLQHMDVDPKIAMPVELIDLLPR